MSNKLSTKIIEESYSLNKYIINNNFKTGINKEFIFKKLKFYLKKINNFFYLILKKYYFLILFFSSYFLFYLSLEKCFESIDACCRKEYWIKKKVIEEFLSCLIISLLIELIYYNKISKLNLIHLFIVFSCFYKFSHGLDFDDHGYFNFLFLFIVVFIIIFCCIPFNVYIYLKKRKNAEYIFLYYLDWL